MGSEPDLELTAAQERLLERFAPDTRVRRIRWSHGETQVLELGDGPPLLLVHGVGAGRSSGYRSWPGWPRLIACSPSTAPMSRPRRCVLVPGRRPQDTCAVLPRRRTRRPRARVDRRPRELDRRLLGRGLHARRTASGTSTRHRGRAAGGGPRCPAPPPRDGAPGRGTGGRTSRDGEAVPRGEPEVAGPLTTFRRDLLRPTIGSTSGSLDILRSQRSTPEGCE